MLRITRLFLALLTLSSISSFAKIAAYWQFDQGSVYLRLERVLSSQAQVQFGDFSSGTFPRIDLDERFSRGPQSYLIPVPNSVLSRIRNGVSVFAWVNNKLGRTIFYAAVPQPEHPSVHREIAIANTIEDEEPPAPLPSAPPMPMPVPSAPPLPIAQENQALERFFLLAAELGAAARLEEQRAQAAQVRENAIREEQIRLARIAADLRLSAEQQARQQAELNSRQREQELETRRNSLELQRQREELERLRAAERERMRQKEAEELAAINSFQRGLMAAFHEKQSDLRPFDMGIRDGERFALEAVLEEKYGDDARVARDRRIEAVARRQVIEERIKLGDFSREALLALRVDPIYRDFSAPQIRWNIRAPLGFVNSTLTDRIKVKFDPEFRRSMESNPIFKGRNLSALFTEAGRKFSESEVRSFPDYSEEGQRWGARIAYERQYLLGMQKAYHEEINHRLQNADQESINRSFSDRLEFLRNEYSTKPKIHVVNASVKPSQSDPTLFDLDLHLVNIGGRDFSSQDQVFLYSSLLTYQGPVIFISSHSEFRKSYPQALHLRQRAIADQAIPLSVFGAEIETRISYEHLLSCYFHSFLADKSRLRIEDCIYTTIQYDWLKWRETKYLARLVSNAKGRFFDVAFAKRIFQLPGKPPYFFWQEGYYPIHGYRKLGDQLFPRPRY